MYDPETTAFLAAAPALEGRKSEELAADLTRAYTWLAAVRLRLGPTHEGRIDSATEEATPEARTTLRALRRLASTYEAMAVAKDRPNRERAAAAFVAGTAHQLLAQAISLGLEGDSRVASIDAHAVSPAISAMLLFQVAGYPSDSREVATEYSPPDGSLYSDQLARAIRGFCRGEYGAVRAPGRWRRRSDEDEYDSACELLFRRLHLVVFNASRSLRDGTALDRDAYDRELAAITELSVHASEGRLSETLQQLARDSSDPPLVPFASTFAGPYHLSRLLRAIIEDIERYSIAQLSPPPGVPPNRWSAFLPRIARRRPFLWVNHLEAVERGYLATGTSAVLTFPTGAGKSTLSELKIGATIANGRHVLYLTPTHALAGQVTSELQQTLGDDARVAQSLVAESEYAELDPERTADVAVMTPERCLTLLSVGPEAFQGLGLVVFDECHLLHARDHDSSRRAIDAMMCLLGLLEQAPSADVLLLSAMVENADELADWIAEVVGRPCVPLTLDWKPTRQARACVVFSGHQVQHAAKALREARDDNRASGTPYKRPPQRIRNRVTAEPLALFGLSHNWTRKIAGDSYSLQKILDEPISLAGGSWSALDAATEDAAALLAARMAQLNIRVLVFVQARRSCDSMARAIGARLSDTEAPKSDERDASLFRSVVEELGSPEASLITLSDAVDQHHGLLLYQERRLAEYRFERVGGTRVLVATGTLAQGMNLPAQAVVIAGTKRYSANAGSAGGWKEVGAEELLNAAGRAGRAGKNATGISFLVPSDIVAVDGDTANDNWQRLYSNVLSKRDQCLRVDDPLLSLLDEIQVAAGEVSPSTRYFLDRLPMAAGDDDSAVAERLLNRSLSGFRARRMGQTAAFAEKVRRVPLVQRRLNAAVEEAPELAWLDATAWKLGVPVAGVRSIHRALERGHPSDQAGVLDWLGWMFDWLVRADDVVRSFLPVKRVELALPWSIRKAWLAAPTYSSDILSAIHARVLLWMRGEPLTAIEASFDDASRPRSSKSIQRCERARKFALRFMLDLSYAAGAIALVRRHQLASETEFPSFLKPQLPLALGSLASCIRDGVDSPGALAVRQSIGPLLSRAAAIREFARIEPYVQFDGTFPDLIRAVEEGLRKQESSPS